MGGRLAHRLDLEGEARRIIELKSSWAPVAFRRAGALFLYL
jgi:hypothetical protein